MTCPFCRASLEVLVERAASFPIEPPPEPAVKNPVAVPWEEQGRAAGFFLTAWSAMSSPRSFFRQVGSEEIGRAPSFALWILLPAIAVQASAYLIFRRGGPFDTEALLRYGGLVMLASTLSIAYLGTFYQLASSLITGRRVAFPATVRALCFGFAPMLLALVPIAGLVIGLAWSLLLHAIALREIHGLTPLKSFAVVAFPIAVVAVKLW